MLKGSGQGSLLPLYKQCGNSFQERSGNAPAYAGTMSGQGRSTLAGIPDKANKGHIKLQTYLVVKEHIGVT